MIIRATTDLIATDRIADEQLRGRLDDIVHASDRGISLVKQLLGFAKNQKLQPEPVDLNCVLKDLAEMLPRLLDENVELVVSHDKPLPVVQADRSQLFQAIVNLAINARDAMTQGGRLSIDAEAVVLDEYYACRCPEVRPGQYVMVAVSDSGTGIPKDIQAKMFDPFFTTKPAGKGTGLGLSVVHGIVHQYGGHLSVYSEPGIGTVIKLYFPVALEPLEKKEEPGQTGKAGTVLLAEDDMTLRRIIRETLVLNGYRVLEGENGLEALQQARHCRETIDVVVTDVMMPKMGGPELAQRVRAVCPRARIVYPER